MADSSVQRSISEGESVAARLFRSPLLVGLALLGTIGAAFQVAGVTSMLLANIILAAGVWIFITAEVWCSKWIKKTGRYTTSVVLLASSLSGILTVGIAITITGLKQQQTRNSASGVPPKSLLLPYSESKPQLKGKKPETNKDKTTNYFYLDVTIEPSTSAELPVQLSVVNPGHQDLVGARAIILNGSGSLWLRTPGNDANSQWISSQLRDVHTQMDLGNVSSGSTLLPFGISPGVYSIELHVGSKIVIERLQILSLVSG